LELPTGAISGALSFIYGGATYTLSATLTGGLFGCTVDTSGFSPGSTVADISITVTGGSVQTVKERIYFTASDYICPVVESDFDNISKVAQRYVTEVNMSTIIDNCWYTALRTIAGKGVLPYVLVDRANLYDGIYSAVIVALLTDIGVDPEAIGHLPNMYRKHSKLFDTWVIGIGSLPAVANTDNEIVEARGVILLR
jgi:hypothetical protein